MNICVLDGYTLNPGDLSWEALESLGPCTIYERSSPEEIVARARDAEAIFTNKALVKRESIKALPKLQYIGVLATGYNIVDTTAARENNVAVTNVPTYGTESVAQMVFCHLLNLTQHVAEHAQTVQEGDWIASPDFCYWRFSLIELVNQTMGIVGLGRIGRAAAKLALAFGMKVVAFDIGTSIDIPEGVKMLDLDHLFTVSDVVSLHCPLTSENEGLVNKDRLSQMKKTALLINTSRGPLINERDLADALNAGKIAGAGLDVLSVEPPDSTNPLIEAKNCYITPHISWATKAARERLMSCAVENLRAFMNGQPQNVVN